jgi:electron transfer flavoprotein alpha subunit
MTVLCLIEPDHGGVADVSLRALTFARALSSAPVPDDPPSSPAPPAPPGGGHGDEDRSSMYRRAGSGPPDGTSMSPEAGADASAGPSGMAEEVAGAAEVAGGCVAPPVGGVAPAVDGVTPPVDGVAGAASGVVAVVFGAAGSVPVGDLGTYGVSDAYAVESPQLGGYAPQAWARALAGLAGELSASAVVAAGTDHGSEVMAHLGAITGLPVAANCVSAEARAGTLRLVRHRWAGSLLEDAVLDASPALLTVAVDAVAAAEADAPVATGVHSYEPEFADADLVVRAAESAERSAGVSLATARVVVGGGRGVGGPDGFGVLEELAGLLGGVVGVSRVVTSEGWRPHKQQVGQTGTRISPELYLACGISGAIQHMAGCLSAKHIVAVNTDPDAPIIGHADFAVVGDLNQVIPALVAAIRARQPG